MRLLYARNADECTGTAKSHARTEPRRDRPLHERQHLPLWHLFANHLRHRKCRQGDERRCQMKKIQLSGTTLDLEPERYELFDDIELGQELDRREFFRL